MIYLKQLLVYRIKPLFVDWVLYVFPYPISNVNFAFRINKTIKKCKFSKNQYLHIYRIILNKIIETLDCIVLDNQKEFIPPYKNIHVYYNVLLFIYNDIARRKFYFQQEWETASFNEVENLAGDPINLINAWKENRSKYLDYRGDIETQFSLNGCKTFPLPYRLEVILGQVDEIIANQKQQYSKTVSADIKWKNRNTLIHKGKELVFQNKEDNMRRKLIAIFIKNKNSIKSEEIREKLELSYDLFKSIKKQINSRLKTIDLKIYYDKNNKVYRLISLT